MMLETTLTTEFRPGTNVKGEITAANWIFLLPSLELNRILCLGNPNSAALRTLSRIGRTVCVQCETTRQLQRVSEAIGKYGLENVQTYMREAESFMDAAQGIADLVFLSGWKTTHRIIRDANLRQQALKLLAPGGFLYFEFAGFLDKISGGQLMRQSGKNGRDFNLYWLTPLKGETQTAVLAADRKTVRYLYGHHLYSPTFPFLKLPKVERMMGQSATLKEYTQRYGVLAGQLSGISKNCPPQYLISIASSSGVDLSSYRWALSARGRFNSRKVLFFLFEEEKEKPEFIVKIVRDPTLNYRLESEWKALSAIQGTRLPELASFPRPVFYGYHAGVAMLGETVLAGVPFKQKSRDPVDSAYGPKAVEWLTKLAECTVQKTVVSPAQVASGLEQLFEQFAAIYTVEPRYLDFLAGQIKRIRQFSGLFSTVFQHGDPGTWNAIITPEDEVTFLDWEAAEPQGIPLWDLFYFLRSYTMGAAPRLRHYDRIEAFRRQFIDNPSLASMVMRSVEQYCRRIDLSGELIEPLFYTCWMHRSLKQATLLPKHKLSRGHYLNLLQLCIDLRENPTFEHLFEIR